jgi:YHS domain-containing protein
MNKIGVLLITVALTLGPAGSILAQGAPSQAQTVCPVLGGNIDKNIFVDYKGQRIYFCCPGCDAEFKKDPEKYVKEMESQGIKPEMSPAATGKGK